MANNKVKGEKKGVFIYEGYYNAMCAIESVSRRWRLFDAIMRYSLYGEEVKLSEELKPIFLVVKPFIDKENGVISAKIFKKGEGGYGGEREDIKNSKSGVRGGKASVKVLSSLGGGHNKNDNCDHLEGGGYDNCSNKTLEMCVRVRNKNKNENQKNNQTKNLLLSEGDASGAKKVNSGNAKDGLEEEKGKKVTKKEFVPPTLQEVEEFCKSASIMVSPKYFYGYYSSKGWVKGGEPLYDWKACILKWQENREIKENAYITKKEKEEKIKQEAINERLKGYEDCFLDLNNCDIENLI